MSTKLLADALGVTRCKRRVQLSMPRSNSNGGVIEMVSVDNTLPVTVAASAVSVVSVPSNERQSCLSSSSGTASVFQSTVLNQSLRRRSIPAPRRSTAVVNAQPVTRKYGQCSQCLRVICLTSAGLVRSHGSNTNCSGSGQLPVNGSASIASSLSSISHGTQVINSAAVSTNHTQSSADVLELLRVRRRRVLKRIPKASRIPAADKLAETLGQIMVDPDSVVNWVNLLSFSFICFGVPDQRGGQRHLKSLASKVNSAVACFPASSAPAPLRKPSKNRQSSEVNLAARVSSKLEDGDIRGAIRLAASDDTLAPFDDVTVEILRTKHPSRVLSDKSPPTPNSNSCLVLQQSDIQAAIKAFAPGSSGGLDGMRPQHLKDLTSASAGEAGQRLLCQVLEFTNLCLSGRVPAVIQPVFCGAALCALNKKEGGIRPIAVGSTLRRLVAKAACKAVTAKMAARFLPVQIGFGIPRATEAVAHAARAYVTGLQPGEGLLKLDFKNAFNMVHRDTMFQTVQEELPELYPFVHMCYSAASILNFGEHVLLSDEGFQQGDPLGPLLFCASSLKLARSMTSEFNVWYLDDGSLGGNVSSLLRDLEIVRNVGPAIGLVLNEVKCEIVSDDVNVVANIKAVMPNIRHIPCCESVLLGAPIGDETAVDTILASKLSVFRLLARRLTSLTAHDALFLLKNCFSIPKLLYSLRCAACYKSTILTQYDDVIRQSLKTILNVDLSDVIWNQATLPVSSGGLGVRLSVDLSLPAFLSSVNGASALSLQLLPSRLHAQSGTKDPVYVAACLEWKTRYDASLPDQALSSVQKAWDTPIVNRKYKEVLSAAQNQAGRARLIAAAAPHSGDFLHAIPCSSLGTRLDDTSLRIAVSLRLGAAMCAPHTCVCGQQVDTSGVHGLACRKSAGRHIRHNAVNHLIKRALASANIPSMLEPISLCRDDGKRPDGLTVLPWANGRCLVWDFTCPDTLATSHLNRAVSSPSAVANDAESRKSAKYRSLASLYQFVPLAVETLGALGDEATVFFRDLGQRIASVTSEPRSTQFLLQRLSVTVQRGNAACVLGTVSSTHGLDELFYI